ncbi:hypothetical protein [Desulfoluna butyratoxydans]|uniref:hypothetical protein n=1 Tax=Desulfoluna butyratoxydans TaxID=231438 RepID=UPI0015D34E6E|nr:hypothetical protein [Desulfoluna butyratoxydans]
MRHPHQIKSTHGTQKQNPQPTSNNHLAFSPGPVCPGEGEKYFANLEKYFDKTEKLKKSFHPDRPINAKQRSAPSTAITHVLTF